ncbi:MAG: hypothetical protein AAGA17_00165 [Actinomycetota bacterium]
MSDLPTTIFDVYDALTGLLPAWVVDETLQGEQFLDNDDKPVHRWALWIGNASEAGSETELDRDLGDPISRDEQFSIEWAIVGNEGRGGLTAAELRAEIRAHLERLQALISADVTLGGACSWCTVSVEFLDHGTTDAGSLARVGGSFEILSLLAAQ